MTLASDFQQHLANGELHVQLCNSCGHRQMYPRQRCLACYSKDLGWSQVSGKATLLSYTVVRAAAPTAFAEDVPYALGVVKLNEGPQLLARLAPGDDGDFSAYRCDLPIRFSPAPPVEIERRPVAWFAPEGEVSVG